MVVLTDFADFPPRFWIEPGLDRVVVGTDEARELAGRTAVRGGGRREHDERPEGVGEHVNIVV